MATVATSKDTIYVDVDDEITAIIDKVRSSDGKIVALVLPKRASVFQSVVNMKLLKRSAEAVKKNLVLVTTESSLMPLAGSVGLHVAATPQSKPEIPPATQPLAGVDDVLEAAAEPDQAYTAENAGDRPIGELAGQTNGNDVETVALPASDEAVTNPVGTAETTKTKRIKIPSFNKFRLRLFLGALFIILIVVGLYFALKILPKATIAISTNTSTLNASLTMTLDTSATTLDTTKLVVPAKAEQQQVSTSQQVNTTGQKNTGTVASGTITMTATECAPNLGQPAVVPAGTGVSTSGLTFITQADTKFAASGIGKGSCVTYQALSSTAMTAQNGGTKFNVSDASFTVANRSDVTGSGSATGGTDNIIQIVTQADIDNAKQKLASQDTASVKTSLEQTLQKDGMYPVPVTFVAGTPAVTTSNNVGDQATTVTVTQAVTYSMYGAKQADLDTLVKANVDTQINTSEQVILDDGLSAASMAVVGSGTGTQQISLQTTATVGPDINITTIKKQIAGKQLGDVKASITNIPGVTSVNVHFSPFWVSSVPINPAKVTVTISGTNQTSHGKG